MLSKWLKHRRCRLKKELEHAAEKCSEVPELTGQVDPHQKVRDVKVKGAPGTKVESMKVVHLLLLHYCHHIFCILYYYLYYLHSFPKTEI